MERTDAVAALFEKARHIARRLTTNWAKLRSAADRMETLWAWWACRSLDGLGIAGAGAHTLDEFVLVSDIAKRATLVTALLST